MNWQLQCQRQVQRHAQQVQQRPTQGACLLSQGRRRPGANHSLPPLPCPTYPPARWCSTTWAAAAPRSRWSSTPPTAPRSQAAASPRPSTSSRWAVGGARRRCCSTGGGAVQTLQQGRAGSSNPKTINQFKVGCAWGRRSCAGGSRQRWDAGQTLRLPHLGSRLPRSTGVAAKPHSLCNAPFQTRTKGFGRRLGRGAGRQHA